jgi:hypothetical protein
VIEGTEKSPRSPREVGEGNWNNRSELDVGMGLLHSHTLHSLQSPSHAPYRGEDLGLSQTQQSQWDNHSDRHLAKELLGDLVGDTTKDSFLE